MKKKENILALLLMIVFITVACSSEQEINRTKFKKLDQAAQEVKTSLA